jgi:hypothetical protein
LTLWVRLPAINTNRRSDTWPPSVTSHEIRDARGIRDAPVRLRATTKEVMADEVDILEIEEDCDILSHDVDLHCTKTDFFMQ